MVAMISSAAAAASDTRISGLNRTIDITGAAPGDPGPPSRLARGQRAVVGLPPAALHDERHVDLIGLVVEAQRVHHQVDAHAEGELALALAAGLAREVVVTEVVALPRAAEVGGDVGRDDPAVADPRLHRRGDLEPAERTIEQVKRLVD